VRSSFFWYGCRPGATWRGPLAYAACGPSTVDPSWADAEPRLGISWSEVHDPWAGGGFGVARPLRFLALRLGLDRDQVAELAKILDRVKIERAQASVDLRRAAAEVAETLEAPDFDRERARGVHERRLEASRRVQDALTRAIEELHQLLDADQRRRLATLIRSGALKL
jgi:hypothetical protein